MHVFDPLDRIIHFSRDVSAWCSTSATVGGGSLHKTNTIANATLHKVSTIMPVEDVTGGPTSAISPNMTSQMGMIVVRVIRIDMVATLPCSLECHTTRIGGSHAAPT
jgi:hypothetical protein